MRTAIIGVGKVADLHARAIQLSEGAKLVTVMARDLGRARTFGARYGVPGYASWRELFGDSRPELVLIATPHPMHAGPALEAIASGCHVLVEKPLASSLEDCDRMIAAAERQGVVLATISQRRFYEPCLRIRDAIDRGGLGTPILGSAVMHGWRDEAYYRSDPWRGSWSGEGGGVLVNQAPHQIDLLLWYLGEVTELYGHWANVNHPYIEVEDTAVAVLKFRSGALATLCVSNAQRPAIHGRVTVAGSNGATVGVQTDGGAMFIAGMSPIAEPPFNHLWTLPGEQDRLKDWRESDVRIFTSIDPTVHYHRLQIEDLVRAIQQSRTPLVTGADGRRCVEIFTAIYRCQREKRPISFPLAG